MFPRIQHLLVTSCGLFCCICVFLTGAGDNAPVDDYLIPGMAPPPRDWQVRGGSCGECCLWPVFQARGRRHSLRHINQLGGNPGRGLHSHELFVALERARVPYRHLSRRTGRFAWFLRRVVLPQLLQGRPVLIGVKVLPDRHPRWGCDHFILLVGYNRQREELIYNDHTLRRRIALQALLTNRTGYAISNRHRFAFAIAFPLR